MRNGKASTSKNNALAALLSEIQIIVAIRLQELYVNSCHRRKTEHWRSTSRAGSLVTKKRALGERRTSDSTGKKLYLQAKREERGGVGSRKVMIADAGLGGG